MSVSNRLGITELTGTSTGRSAVVDEAIAKLEAGATFFAAKQVLLNAPPGSPAEGDLYVVGTAGSGAWSGHNKNVAIYYNAAWLFFTPFEGMFAWDQTSNSLKYYDGANWVAFTTGAGSIADADYGDITVSSSGSVWTIDNDVVTNAKSANMAQSTIKGRAVGAGTGDPTDLTATQATAILDVMVGDSGAGGTKGLVPAAGAGDTAAGKFLKADGSFAVPSTSAVTESFVIACSDETTALTAGTAKVTFRMPYAFTLSAVRASVTTAPTGGTLLTVDINESGSTILSTKLTFDASEKTTTTAATPAVISDSALADDAEITIDIDTVGSTVAGAGLKVYLIGTQ